MKGDVCRVVESGEYRDLLVGSGLLIHGPAGLLVRVHAYAQLSRGLANREHGDCRQLRRREADRSTTEPRSLPARACKVALCALDQAGALTRPGRSGSGAGTGQRFLMIRALGGTQPAGCARLLSSSRSTRS
jgi:hypothetical protein